MVSDQEPRYRLVDSDGNIVGSLYGKADGSVAIQETDSGADREATLAPDGTFSAPSVETGSLSATGMTNVRAVLSSTQSLTSGNAETVAFDSTPRDTRGEFDTSTNAFSPDETGYYNVGAYLTLTSGNDGDGVLLELREDGSNIVSKDLKWQSGIFGRYSASISVNGIELSSGSSYTVSIRNDDSDDEIRSESQRTFYLITDSGHRV